MSELLGNEDATPRRVIVVDDEAPLAVSVKAEGKVLRVDS